MAGPNLSRLMFRIILVTLGLLVAGALLFARAPVAGSQTENLGLKSGADAISDYHTTAGPPGVDLTTAAFPPDVPTAITDLYLGIPAGNGYRPQRLAIDKVRQRLYTLNSGRARVDSGPSVSVIDLVTGEVSRLLRLAEVPEEGVYSVQALSLVVDPYRPRLYAIWGDPFDQPTTTTLSVVDTDSLTLVDTLPGVAAVAPGPDRIYLVNDARLWSQDLQTLAEQKEHQLEPPAGPVFLKYSSSANRLYLGQNQPASLTIFDATSLAPIDQIEGADRLFRAEIDEANQRLLLIASNSGQQINMTALNLDGQPLSRPAPVLLSDDTYSDLPLTVTGSTVAVASRAPNQVGYTLQIFTGPDLLQTETLPIPGYPMDLAIDSTDGRVYAAYSNPDSYLLAVDPVTGEAEKIYTAIDLEDALADPASDRLYVLDNRDTIQILALSDYANLAEIATAPVTLNCRQTPGCITPGRVAEPTLALDPNKHHLYLSGNPVQVIDTATFQVIETLDTPGQVTPDPTGDRLYLTPPCQCRLEQCNTLILDSNSFTGTQTLFPPADSLTAHCVYATTLDSVNQLLYTEISNGIPGSNGGSYFATFNVSAVPKQIYTAGQISYGPPALDPANRRAFIPRYRMGQTFLHRYEGQGQTITQTLEVVGAGGPLLYDPAFERLYVVSGSALRVFDSDLALLIEISLPGRFKPMSFDSEAQRLYLGGLNGSLLVVAPSGGKLPPPPPPPQEDIAIQPRLFVAPNGVRFRIAKQRLYRAAPGTETWHLLGRGLPSQPVNTLAISPNYAADQTLLVGLGGFGQGSGLYRSTDGGDTWYATTRGLTDFNIMQIVFSPTFAQDQTIFVTTSYKGLFRSRDRADSWTALADRYSRDPGDSQVADLAISPTFAQDGLIFVGYRNLLRSVDAGDTWTDTGLPPGRVAFSPYFSEDGLVLNDGRWRSTDGGLTWQPSAVGLAPARGAQRLFFSPNFAADRTVYILLDRGYEAPPLLQRSVDGGQSWEALQNGLPDNFQPADAAALPDGNLYVSAASGQAAALDPQTLAWGPVPIKISQLDLQDMAAGPDGSLFVANSTAGVFSSTDGGRTWHTTGFPVRAAEIQPARLALAENGSLFAGVGAAIMRSDDRGRQWTYLSNAPTGFEVASLAVSPAFASDGIVLVGGSYETNQIIRSMDGGQSWQEVFDGQLLAVASDVSLITFSPNFARDGLVYAWLQEIGLRRSDDRGLSWTPVIAEPSYIFAQALLVSEDGSRIYLGALDGQLYLSPDGGQTWQQLDEAIPDSRIWSSGLALREPDDLWLGTDVGVYYSPDGGRSWQRASDGLPVDADRGTPPRIRRLQFGGERLYAALNQGGVYVLLPGAQIWQPTTTAPAAPDNPPLPTPPAPLPAPVPTPQTSLPECPNPPAEFVDLWTPQASQLGCPVGSPRQGPMVVQPFSGGWMFWRSDTSTIYALPTGQPYRRYEDTWNNTQPAYTCPDLGPSETPPTPQRGFGKVWCENSTLRQQIGQATGPERGFQATWQPFENGLIFKTDQGVVYILENQPNTWERIE